MQPPKALLLDLDGTLLDERGQQRAVVLTCREIAPTVGVEAAKLIEANQLVWEAYWPTVEARWVLGQLSGAEVSREAWHRALTTCGRTDESLTKLATDAHARYTRDACALYDDAVEMLQRVGNRSLRAVVTNGASDTQREKLRWSDLERQVDAVFISGEHGIAKPDPAIFRIALDQLAVAAGDAWHVGDSLHTDVAGARAAGLTAVWLNRSGTKRAGTDPRPDIEIRSLTELPELWGLP